MDNEATCARPGRDRWFLLVLLAFALPLPVLVLTDAALTWDGAYYLFHMLHTRTPFIAHDRLIDAPLHWPVVLAQHLTDDLPTLRAVFGSLHAVTPLAAIALSWWVVRGAAPALIIWPVLTIGIATLPGQINLISEGIKAQQLFWPVLLAILVRLPPRTIPLAAML